jgi:NAD(P)-dependent dehydrogenase (short-subunit alcohol dehydrogenase family)
MSMSIKTVLVTGGASGIGRAFVERLSQQGWRVCVLDVNESALAELASEQVSTFICDVANLEQVQAAVSAIFERDGAIDRLIHCAAIMPAG